MSLERQTDSKVDREVALEVGVDDGIMLGTRVGRVDGLHTTIEAEDEVVEIEAKTKAIGNGDLTPEGVEAELTARLILVITHRPDVTGIDKQGTVYLPEHMAAVLGIHVELDVTRLIDEVDATVGTHVGTRAKTTDAPSTHTVGTATEVALLVGQNRAVAIGVCDTKADVHSQRVTLVETETLGKVEVALDIFGIGDVEEGVLALLVLGTAQRIGDAIEEVARRLDGKADAVGIAAIVARGTGEGLRIVLQHVTPLHDEQVFVVVTKDGISGAGVVEIIALEGLGNPGHEDVVEVEQVDAMLHLGVAIPAIAPRSGDHTTVEFGTVLTVVLQ